MKITLTGATGFIGSLLCDRLAAGGHELTLLSRRPRAGSKWNSVAWDPARDDAPAAALEGRDAVIHLAGEPVAQRWNTEVKNRIRDSRVDGTRRLVRSISRLAHKPSVLVSASAVGIYGSRGDEILTEASPPASGFLPDVTAGWEREAMAAESSGLRVALIRIGIVLGKGGALKTMLPPFRMGVGGRLGSGQQWMSWVHVHDLVDMIRFALESPGVRGPLNGTAPNPVRNEEFTRTLASALHRPAIFPVPEFALNLLFGEMSAVMLSSQRVLPEAAGRAGFKFRFPELKAALDDILRA